jgi:N-acetylglucosamine-6-phosphate deacetylase
METIALKNATVILSDEKRPNVSLLINNGQIAEISFENKDYEAEKNFDLTDFTLYAGFIDIHIHGAVGVDVNSANTAGLQKAAEFLAKNGVTAWLPTFVPDSDENYWKGVAAIEDLVKIQSVEPIAQVLGVHYEGVFANEKMCGALRP